MPTMFTEKMAEMEVTLFYESSTESMSSKPGPNPSHRRCQNKLLSDVFVGG